MTRKQIKRQFEDIDRLISEIDYLVPLKVQNTEIRAKFARLLIISIVSAYETSIKTTMIEFAEKKHREFGNYVENHKKKINARIKRGDLINYSGEFSDEIEEKFRRKLERLRTRYARLSHSPINELYDELIKQRHAVAHSPLSDSNISTATIEETSKRHRVAKQIIFAFHDAFQ